MSAEFRGAFYAGSVLRLLFLLWICAVLFRDREYVAGGCTFLFFVFSSYLIIKGRFAVYNLSGDQPNDPKDPTP